MDNHLRGKNIEQKAKETTHTHIRVRERIQTTRQADESEIGRKVKKREWMNEESSTRSGWCPCNFRTIFRATWEAETNRPLALERKKKIRFVNYYDQKILPCRNFITSRGRTVSLSDENFWGRSIWCFLIFRSSVFFFYFGCFKLKMITLIKTAGSWRRHDELYL